MLLMRSRNLRVNRHIKYPPRACAHPRWRERELRARTRPKANAVVYEKKKKQASGAERRRDGHFTSTSQDPSLWAEISRPVGLCYRRRRLRIYTGRNNTVSRRNFHLWSRRRSKESVVRCGKWRCGCSSCTSFLCLKMADRPLGLEQQVPCQRQFTLVCWQTAVEHLQ